MTEEGVWDVKQKSSGVGGFRDRMSDAQTRAGLNSRESEYGRQVNLLNCEKVTNANEI